MEKSYEGEEELAKALNTVLSNMYQQLQKAVEDKVVAEQARKIAEEKTEELLRTIQ